jgi:hypothetical protein
MLAIGRWLKAMLIVLSAASAMAFWIFRARFLRRPRRL